MSTLGEDDKIQIMEFLWESFYIKARRGKVYIKTHFLHVTLYYTILKPD